MCQNAPQIFSNSKNYCIQIKLFHVFNHDITYFSPRKSQHHRSSPITREHNRGPIGATNWPLLIYPLLSPLVHSRSLAIKIQRARQAIKPRPRRRLYDEKPARSERGNRQRVKNIHTSARRNEDKMTGLSRAMFAACRTNAPLSSRPRVRFFLL